jgi:hypothetical protein
MKTTLASELICLLLSRDAAPLDFTFSQLGMADASGTTLVSEDFNFIKKSNTLLTHNSDLEMGGCIEVIAD